MRTLLLGQNTWDLTLDASANIAVAEEPYAFAQDAASACRTFLGEVWHDSSLGIPYLQQILGKRPSAQFVRAQLEAATLTVPDTTSAAAFLTSFVNRKLSTQVQFTAAGATGTIGTSELQGPMPWYVSAVSPQAAGAGGGGP